MEGPDHKASLEPPELKAMVRGVRNVSQALGDGVKGPSKSEIKNKVIARKSIVAARSIRCGEILGADNMATKRPGNGLSPMLWDSVVGKQALRDYEADDLI